MIAKASSVSHGYNAINYAMTKNDAKYINSNHLPVDEVSAMLGNYDPDGVWEAMQDRKNSEIGKAHHNIKNDVIRIEIAPSEEEAATLKTDEDWNKLLQQWMVEMEKVANKKDKKDKPKSLDFKNSQWIAMCHFDSGKPHIHLIVNRVREDGTINNDSNIGRNATKAANAVNEQRGWKQSAEIHDEKIENIYNDAMDCLRAMPKFNWSDYKRLMAEKGYDLSMRRDKQGKVVSYRVADGNSSYKASEIGPGKKLTAGHIFTTWLKEHPEAQYNSQDRQNRQSENNKYQPKETEYQPTGTENFRSVEEHQEAVRSMPNITTLDYETSDGWQKISLPTDICREIQDSVYDTTDKGETDDINNEIMPLAAILWQAAATTGELAKAYFDIGTQITEGGGGGGGVHGELSSWGRDPNEDLLELARRAGRTASKAMTSRSRGRGGRRR